MYEPESSPLMKKRTMVLRDLANSVVLVSFCFLLGAWWGKHLGSQMQQKDSEEMSIIK